ncbi:hypothetical protein EAX61_02955 [Dokdonia sinensis]|uniref:Uncharacterized protein n=1 Tax=Dokdonia sinensis TaxID=2479847 RepID=A0A3M0GFS6_9FLAO|nr:hypothetical protein [Dokdonia sinensis]RMB63367.1 hypothetical protein EAX61_02955 [Dokdonia sinensis]
MKTLILIFSIFTLGFTTEELSRNDEINVETFIYDGFEGGYYFFTDTSRKAVILEADNETTINKNLLQRDDAIGKRFEVRYKKNKQQDDSSQGILVHLEQA